MLNFWLKGFTLGFFRRPRLARLIAINLNHWCIAHHVFIVVTFSNIAFNSTAFAHENHLLTSYIFTGSDFFIQGKCTHSVKPSLNYQIKLH